MGCYAPSDWDVSAKNDGKIHRQMVNFVQGD